MEHPVIEDAARELSSLRKELKASRAETRRLADRLAEAERSRAVADEERLERFRELARMAELVMRTERDFARATKLKDWLQQLSVHLMDRPTWWSLLPRSRRQRQERKALRREKIFDAQDYLAAHPDVKANGMDPLRHYLNHGIDEGRSRSVSMGH